MLRPRCAEQPGLTAVDTAGAGPVAPGRLLVGAGRLLVGAERLLVGAGRRQEASSSSPSSLNTDRSR
ncbi:MAG TPA: hypothetical protein VK038_00990, partial [Ornithinicoccus sp.]|nr:hypothetical protein [Ornithinicoccus sp.]